MAASRIEDHPAGYPRLSALMAADGSFSVYRRFMMLRHRLLLRKQDILSRLECQLSTIDEKEPSLLFLGSQRDDKNEERTAILDRIDLALADYDGLLARFSNIEKFRNARSRSIRSLWNWLSGNGCIARAETRFLTFENDLFCPTAGEDGSSGWCDSLIEDGIIDCCRLMNQKRPGQEFSRDPHVFILSNSRTARIGRALTISALTVLMLAPILICSALRSYTARILVVIFAAISVIGVTSVVTNARVMEIFVGGATYATVLTVFVSTQ